MSFNLNISGHIHGTVEEAKALEEQLVADLRRMVAEIEDAGHSISGQFFGQHTGTVALHTTAVTGDGVAPADASAPGSGPAAPAGGMQAPVEPDGAPTGYVMDPDANPTNAEPQAPVEITSEGVKDLATEAGSHDEPDSSAT